MKAAMKISTTALTAALLFSLSGCGLTQQGDLVRSGIASEGREAAATALENAEWALCRALPVGAIKDRYGRSAELSEAYNRICNSFSEKFLQGEEVPATMPDP